MSGRPRRVALRRAEKISPRRIHRNPLAREVIAALLARLPHDSPAGRELRRMAFRGWAAGVAQPGETKLPEDHPPFSPPGGGQGVPCQFSRNSAAALIASD